MGDIDRPGDDGGHSGRGSRNGHIGHRTTSPTGRAHSSLSEKYYRSLLQLAALLTGDAGVAEAVVADVLAAIPVSAATGWSANDCVSYLQRQVLIRCRRASHYRRQSVRRKEHAASEFARL